MPNALWVRERHRVVSLLIALLVVGWPIQKAKAQVIWPMATEYPESNISGVGLATFSRLVTEHTHGAVAVQPTYDSKLTAVDLLRAAGEGRVAGGDAFAGPLDAFDPIFALPSLPFVVGSTAAAQELNARARPAYEAALARRGLRLLYLTVWPPSGLWSDKVVNGANDLRGLRLRAYDTNSAAVMTAAGANATFLPFGETMTRLKARELDGVLTSGDGGAARGLWDTLKHFTAISYAIPISIAFVRAEAFDMLPASAREGVLASARETEASQFALLTTRVEENYTRMRAHGVTIVDPAPAALIVHLKSSAVATVAAWRDKMPEEIGRLSSQAVLP